LTLRNIADDKEIKVAVPANARLGFGGGGGRGGAFAGGGGGGWSPDGKHFAFTNTTATGIELWVGDAATGAVKRVPGVALNAAYGEAMQWMPDSKTLLCQTIVAGRGKPPAEPKVPTGPNIQESYGKHSPAPTFEDLLKSPHDEDLFEYYATSQLALVNVATLRAAPVGKPAIFSSTEASPDGNHILVVRNHKPYSYILTANAFPKEVEVWNHAGKVEHKLASLPLADTTGVRPKARRSFGLKRWMAATRANLRRSATVC
jgi:dipeptidyl aminopeptidase/acylaminoacyl peptidase